jgi:hypothetical protein
MRSAGLRDFVGPGYADPPSRSPETLWLRRLTEELRSSSWRNRHTERFSSRGHGRDGVGARQRTHPIEHASDACKEQMLCFFKCLNCEFTAHRREFLEEMLKCIAASKVLEQRLDRHPRPSEHWCTVYHIGIPGNRVLHFFIVTHMEH